MDVIFSPWRSKYIETFKDEDKKKSDECFFCEAANQVGKEEELLVVARKKKLFVMLNKFPYNNGHVLIAPYRHVPDLDDLDEDEMSEIMFVVRQTKQALVEMYNPHGFNIGINIGRTAGAGVPGHVHVHVVPRWNGDTSFMTVFAEANVVSQSLWETREKMEAIFKEKFL